jgi:hypothetical protein
MLLWPEHAQGQSAEPNTFYWLGLVSDEWRDGANWSKTAGSTAAFPSRPGDMAVIRPGHIPGVALYPARAGARSVISLGELVIEPGASISVYSSTLVVTASGRRSGRLTIQRTGPVSGALNINTLGTVRLDAPTTHEIGGRIELGARNSTLVISRSAALEPWHDLATNVVGTIIGRDESAQIMIAQGQTLTSSIEISGRLVMRASTGEATFENKGTGIVHANSDGALELAGNLTLRDAAAGETHPRYKADTNPGAVLRFKAAGGDLVGDYEVNDCAALEFAANVTSRGDLLLIRGRVAVSADACFTYDSDDKLCAVTIKAGKCDR